MIILQFETMKMLAFTGDDFKAFIEFICENEREIKSACSNDVSVLTPEGLGLDLHVEDESNHLWIHKNHRNVIGIAVDILAKVDVYLLYEILIK